MKRGRDGGRTVQGRRARRALGAVAALVGALAVFGAPVGDGWDAPAQAGGSDASGVQEEAAALGLAGAGLTAADQPAVAAKAQVPDAFAVEVVDPSSFADVRFDAGARVAGWWTEGQVATVFQDTAAVLESKGWVRAGSGQEACGTFQKADGTYRWLFVSCVQVGSAASVVVQYETADERS